MFFTCCKFKWRGRIVIFVYQIFAFVYLRKEEYKVDARSYKSKYVFDRTGFQEDIGYSPYESPVDRNPPPVRKYMPMLISIGKPPPTRKTPKKQGEASQEAWGPLFQG